MITEDERIDRQPERFDPWDENNGEADIDEQVQTIMSRFEHEKDQRRRNKFDEEFRRRQLIKKRLIDGGPLPHSFCPCAECVRACLRLKIPPHTR